MKKAILAIATLAILTVGNSFAQRSYSSKGHSGPAISNQRIDNSYEEYNINKLDDIVSLSRKQENQIKRIENKYDKVVNLSKRPQTMRNIQRLKVQKQQDILAVLTPAQRQRLMAYQHSGRFDNYNKYNLRG